MKPLSAKTLEKKYTVLGLPREKTDLLHDYYAAFSNLYGLITLRDAWKIFSGYEGKSSVKRKDFIAFSDIAGREEGHPYSVLEMKEIFSGETTEDPADRLIVNNRLIGSGYGKFQLIYATEERLPAGPFYAPPDRAGFLKFRTSQFFLTPEGKTMRDFLKNLRTTGVYLDLDGKPAGKILDVDGRPVTGKKLSEFVFYTGTEQFDIEYYKSKSKTERMRAEYKKSALDKILDVIFINLQTGGFLRDERFGELMGTALSFISRELGVSLDMSQTERFCKLFTELNNRSNLWQNAGWRPCDLFDVSDRRGQPEVVFGPNIRNLFDDGTLDRRELERFLAENGFKTGK